MSEDTQKVDLEAVAENRRKTEQMSDEELAELLAEPKVQVSDQTREIDLREVQKKIGQEG